MSERISKIVKEKAPVILGEIKKANSVLLHCHPSPDPDSVGSALAMKFVLEQMGKMATVIRGDSEIPTAFMHFPGANEIVRKDFFEVDLEKFDLFISLDSAAPEQISRFKPVTFPLPIKTVVIDHHKTNIGYADLNLIEPFYPAVGQILFELFSLWKIKFTNEIGSNLFVAIYADTGGFKYQNVTPRTFSIASRLARISPNFPDVISRMENSNSAGFIYSQGLALSSVETFLEGKLALSSVSLDKIKEKNISITDIRAGEISPILNTVADWEIVGALFEVEPDKVRLSLRTHNASKFDVSKLASALGGGGHKAAAGAVLNMPIEKARKLIVLKAKKLYNI